jgi:hypothetical protein
MVGAVDERIGLGRADVADLHVSRVVGRLLERQAQFDEM